MAARKQLWHPDDVKAKIQASQLINRLTEHALSDKPIMDASQVTAATKLLAKVVPDLSAMTIDGGLDNTTRVISERPLSTDEWAAEHADLGTPARTTGSIN